MYLSATLIIAALSFFVEATPTSRSGIAIPITKRTLVHDANGVVDIARLQRSASHSAAKFHNGFNAYQRNTGARHPSAPEVKRLEKRTIGIEPLISMYGPITVGTPPKTFTVNFDSGSSDLFLPSSACDDTCQGHALYNALESSTAHPLGSPFNLGYADGSSVKGTLYTDDVTIAGYTAKSQTFGGATSYVVGFRYPGWLPDGLIGMGWPDLSHYGASPFFHTLVAQGSLPTNSFGMYLGQNYTELYLGGTNSLLHKGDFTYVPVTQEGYWQTNFDGLYLNGQQIIGTTVSIVDSGTAMILGDKKNVQAFYDQIPGSFHIGSGYYSIPCSFNSEISIQFGAANIKLALRTFNYGTFSEDPNACVGAFVGWADDSPFWVFGDAFMRNVYTEFDVGNKRIGFATPV